LFRGRAKILEIGSGTGQQALVMSQLGFDVAAIDVGSSNYSDARVFPILNYDGRVIPFPDSSFDIVYSSNVLEHVRDLEGLLTETRRVLRQGGISVHILPTHTWRLWTILSALPAAARSAASLVPDLLSPSNRRASHVMQTIMRMGWRLLQPFNQRRHGERGNLISELWLFNPAWWRRKFRQNNFVIIREEPAGIFYTGNMILAERWSVSSRRKVAKILGSSSHVFVLSVRFPDDRTNS
jgi:SAM-dependent methyltransferase